MLMLFSRLPSLTLLPVLPLACVRRLRHLSSDRLVHIVVFMVILLSSPPLPPGMVHPP